MVTGLLRKAVTLLGMGGPWRDWQIPDVIGLSDAAEMIQRHRNVVLYWAQEGKILSARAGSGAWIFRLDHILEVIDLLKQTGGNIDQVAWMLRERAKKQPGPSGDRAAELLPNYRRDSTRDSRD